MNEQEYLNQAVVKDFIKWIKPKLFTEFKHSYTISRGVMWECNSLFNAYEQYRWPISPDWVKKLDLPDNNSFTSNKTVLDHLSEKLRSSFEEKNLENFFEASKKILSWGGVLGSEKRGNAKYLTDNMQDLITIFANAKIQMLENGTLLNDFNGIRMNAGYTKIYSLLFDDFIIYDGRVGAALGLLVRKFLEDRNINIIPEELNFYWGKSKGTHDRNPSTGPYKFKQLNNSKNHIKCNLKANWLIKKIIKTHGFGNETKGYAMRAIESALFMIGYELSGSKGINRVQDNKIQDKLKLNKSIAKTNNTNKIIMNEERKNLKTLSNNPQDFEYSGSMKDGICIYAGRAAIRRIDITNCKKILERYTKEKNTTVIGTSLDKPTPGSIGAWILNHPDVCISNVASYLAPILVYEGYAELVKGSHPMKLNLHPCNKVVTTC